MNLRTDFPSGICLDTVCSKRCWDESAHVAWQNDIRCESVPDPKIEHERDTIIKVTACAICSSTSICSTASCPRWKGRRLGHETMGELSSRIGKQEAQGSAIASWFHLQSLAENASSARKASSQAATRSNPSQDGREALGPLPAGPLWLFPHVGGYAGGQAEYLRVPMPMSARSKVPQGLSDEQVLFLSISSHGFHGG